MLFGDGRSVLQGYLDKRDSLKRVVIELFIVKQKRAGEVQIILPESGLHLWVQLYINTRSNNRARLFLFSPGTGRHTFST